MNEFTCEQCGQIFGPGEILYTDGAWICDGCVADILADHPDVEEEMAKAEYQDDLRRDR